MGKIMEKLTSGRFIATVSMILTYCFLVTFVTIKYAGSLVSNPEKMESFAVGLIMGFSGTAAIVIKSYFDRSDRAPEKSTGGTNG